MLVHSYIYYQLNDSIISDHDFDRWARELVDLQKKYPKEAKKARFHKEFQDFTGSTGFDLPYSIPEIQAKGNWLLEYHKKQR